MDDFLDIVWSKIVVGVGHAYAFVNQLFAPLEVMGPLPVIILLVVITVCLTKVLSRVYTTRRYETLKKEFKHYYNLRQEALACEDREKGKLLAKNIDQGKLNKVYYDYFFEGLLKNILTIYLPCLIVAAYVNEAYKADNLMAKFGRPYVFQWGSSHGEPTVMGALFCYVLLLLTAYFCWYLAGKAVGRKQRRKNRNKAAAQGINPD
jgi:uncharacterized membrane protein (DUF106 family)